MSGRLQLRLLDPELGESSLFMKWLARRHGVRLSAIKLRVGYAELFDRVLAIEFPHEDILVRVAAPYPEPTLSRTTVRDALLQRIDGAMLVFARTRSAMAANAAAVDELMPRLTALGIQPVIALNDSMRGDKKTTLSAAAAATELRLGAGVHETTLGPPRGALEYDAGVEAAWTGLLEKSRRRAAATPYR